MDQYKKWFDKCCIIDPEYITTLSDMLDSFRLWDNGRSHQTCHQTLFRWLNEKGVKRYKTTNGEHYYGVCLKDGNDYLMISCISTLATDC